MKLMEKGVNADDDWSPFHAATRNGDLETCKAFIDQKKIDINKKDGEKWTPLHVACYYNQADPVDREQDQWPTKKVQLFKKPYK